MFDHPYYTNLMLQCDVFKIITLENVTSYFSFSYFSILLIIFIKTLTPFHLLPCRMQDIAFELQQKYIIIRFRQKKKTNCTLKICILPGSEIDITLSTQYIII